ncbi:unnamed protein product [Paramecium primaurelia]|uniref:Exportin-1/Importin-beta-like domain-containing protein n=1 Tax=Paramecium primaurelia TaxID=5886 RepID=A0A8S1JT87_PARPR|nr:unnamed protein product [Paramecium primaurelia]
MFSIEEFIKQYQNLSNPDKNISQEANKYILKLQQTREAFTVAQQILDQQYIQQEYQFIACQLIYRRLKEECDITIQPYLLNLLGRPLSNIALNQVCSSFAVIIVGNSQLWKGILQELIQLMKVKMPIGIEILNQIAIQSKECHSKKEQQKLQLEFQTQESILSEIFLSLLCVQDLNIFKQTISCIESWVQFSYRLFKDSKLIQQIIVLIQHALQNNALEYSDKLFSLLYEAVAYSQFNKNQITEDIVQQNLILMLEFILKIYNPQISVMFASFATKFICDFYPIIQNTQYEEPVLNMMVNIVNNPQRKIVFQTFEFWSQMRQNNLIQGVVLKILQCLIDRCKVKSIKLTKQSLLGESEDEDDYFNKTDYESKDNNISTSDFREHCKEIFISIYKNVEQINQTNSFFQIILSNLVITNPESTEQIIKSEAALFCLCSIIDETDFQINNQLVLQIIQFVLQLPNNQNYDIIVKTTLQMFSGLTNQINLNNELLLQITKYFFQYMLHPLLGSLAGVAFEQISNNSELINQQLISDCVLFLEQHFNDFINQSQLNSFVEGILKLCYRIYSKGNIDCIIQLFNFANNQFQLLKNINLLTKQQFTYINTLIIAILTWINSNIEEINTQVKQISDLLCSSISEPLINLFKESQNLSNNDELYQLVRMIMKVSNYQNHSQSIIQLLQISFQIFYQNPTQKYQWLQLITIAIGRSQEYQFISQWTIQNSQQIHQFCIEQYKLWRDSDLMKIYVEFVKECTRYCQQALFQSPYLFLIMEIISDAFLTLNSYEMQREILNFFKTLSQFIEKGQDYFNQIVIQIVTTLFLSISIINRAIIFQIIQILQFILKKDISSDELKELIYQTLLKSWGANKSPQQVQLVSQAILHYLKKTGDNGLNRELKLLLQNLREMGEEEIDYMHLEKVIKQQ